MKPYPSQSFRANLDSVGHLLRDRRLAVPAYQRSYSWGRDQVIAFLGDLRSALVHEKPEYFLGTIVLTEGTADRLVVIDGQQRLATATMVLAAIRNILAARGDTERAAVIDRDYLTSQSLKTAAIEPRLRLNEEDSSFFAAYVLEQADSQESPERVSHRRIASAMSIVSEAMDTEAKLAGSNWSDRLLAWADLIDRGLRVIVVEVADEGESFLIFETLNDRGLDLTVADLLRNYLFGLAGDAVSSVQLSWLAATAALESPSEDQLFITYLRHYWNSLAGPVRERDLYASLKRAIKTGSRAAEFASALASEAPYYAALLESDHELWLGFQPTVKPAVDSVVRLGLEQNRPLLLAALATFTKAEMERLLRSVVGWSVRGIVVGGIGGGTAERYFAEAALRIRGGEIRDTEAVFSFLSPFLPTDDAFRASFEQLSETRTKFLRYYLMALENRLAGKPHPADVAADNDRLYRVTHVLPRNAQPSQWPAFEPDEVRSWASRMGNAILEPAGLSEGNAATGSSIDLPVLPLTSGLVRDARAWSPDAIRSRQAWLAGIAVETWPRHPVSD